jgi:hypothetical protein
MKALISPMEIRTDYKGDSGIRIAQVEPDDKIFEVAYPLHWIDCPDECIADVWWYFENICQIMPQPPEPPPEPPEINIEQEIDNVPINNAI